MAVKDILQELCDCDLISFDKIGSGNFYWCFPSEALNKRKVHECKLLQEIESYQNEINEIEKQIEELEPSRIDCKERTDLDAEVKEFEAKLKIIQKESEPYEKMNPDAIHLTEKQSAIALDAANRWTDNIFTVKSWCTKSFGLLPSAFDQNFGITEDFDYLS